MAGSTQRVIRKTFMELLEERPLNEITVKLIVERCGINRKTFYNHYRDIPDLMEKILTDEVCAIPVVSTNLQIAKRDNINGKLVYDTVNDFYWDTLTKE